MRLKRFRVAQPPQDVLDRYLREYESRVLHYAPDTYPAITSREFFGSDRPLVCDLGCGRGEFITAEAAANPDLNYMGFDYHWKSLWRAVELAHAGGLENVRFVRCDFRRVVRKIPDNTLAALYLLFPPPAPLYNKPKADTLTAESLAEYHRVLAQGAPFHFVTDKDAYFAEKRALIEACGLFTIVTTAEQFEGGITRFQTFWETRDISSKRLEGRKRAP